MEQEEDPPLPYESTTMTLISSELRTHSIHGSYSHVYIILGCIKQEDQNEWCRITLLKLMLQYIVTEHACCT